MRPLVYCLGIISLLSFGLFHWDGAKQAYKRHLALNALAAIKTPEFQPFNLARELESGNIGKIERRSKYTYDLHLRSDNDEDLPHYWRQWWYTKLEKLPMDKPVSFTLRGRGHWNYYIPVYSYDNLRWHHFDQKNVTQPGRNTLRFKKKFKQSEVYMARYYPYTYTKFKDYLKRHETSPYLQKESLGSSKFGLDVPALTITDPTIVKKKAQVIIHGRTHPGEVASSYLVEGLLTFLLGPSKEAKTIRRNLVVRVVPILNVDGVVIGNNRVNPEGINLEGKWFTHKRSAKLDFQKSPFEVQQFYKKLRQWTRKGPPVTVALNVHSSNGTPADKTFFFPHFGPRRLGYSRGEAKLWNDQLRFINHMAEIKGRSWFNKPPRDGKRDFISKSVPESWWWKKHGPNVMALTIEATFGRAGSSKRWIKPNDIRSIGSTVGQALVRYHNLR